jgi:hypothetical protein
MRQSILNHFRLPATPTMFISSVKIVFVGLSARQAIHRTSAIFVGGTIKPEDKSSLIEPLLGRFQIADKFCTLFECATRMVNSLVQFFSKETTTLEIPFPLIPVPNAKPF